MLRAAWGHDVVGVHRSGHGRVRPLNAHLCDDGEFSVRHAKYVRQGGWLVLYLDIDFIFLEGGITTAFIVRVARSQLELDRFGPQHAGRGRGGVGVLVHRGDHKDGVRGGKLLLVQKFGQFLYKVGVELSVPAHGVRQGDGRVHGGGLGAGQPVQVQGERRGGEYGHDAERGLNRSHAASVAQIVFQIFQIHDKPCYAGMRSSLRTTATARSPASPNSVCCIWPSTDRGCKRIRTTTMSPPLPPSEASGSSWPFMADGEL